MSTRLTVYGRPDCHLCDQAERRVLEIAAECGVELDIERIDIELDEALHRDFFDRIPVVEIDGERIGELGDFRRRSFSDRVRDTLNA